MATSTAIALCTPAAWLGSAVKPARGVDGPGWVAGLGPDEKGVCGGASAGALPDASAASPPAGFGFGSADPDAPSAARPALRVIIVMERATRNSETNCEELVRVLCREAESLQQKEECYSDSRRAVRYVCLLVLRSVSVSVWGMRIGMLRGRRLLLVSGTSSTTVYVSYGNMLVAGMLTFLPLNCFCCLLLLFWFSTGLDTIRTPT